MAIMTDEMVCIKHNGVSYCWNFMTSSVEVLTKEQVKKNDCPAEVLYELLELVSKRVQVNKEG